MEAVGARGTGQAMRRRPPCRDFGRDARARELSERLVGQGRALSALQRQLFSDIAEFDAAEAWRGDGAISMRSWLMERCGVSGGTAGKWVRTARRLESLPHLSGAFASGDLSLDAVSPLAEVATPANDAHLAARSAEWSVQQVRELAAAHKGKSDAAAARQFEHRTWRCNDAQRTMWAAFTDDDYAEVKALLVGRVWGKKGVGAAGEDALGPISFDQRMYDAVMDLFRVGGDPAGGLAARPTVVLHAPLELMMGAGGGYAEIQGIGPVSTEVARRLACDAHITVSVEGVDGCILDQGRARRDPTTAQRIEIARRDKGCRFPDCSFTDFTHVHHMHHWVKGGQTNLDNLITLCGRHHRAVHELGWKMEGDADDVVTFTSPRGQQMRSVPSPTWRQRPMRR